ncbi:hypothetical protein [Roseomonas indoligenes]|uniref:Uncharacterized protein n=1 Tax=Roseomonas indoligenes TaxID=2820811 RepID=A0A940MSM8_9PROT|nr:hypothetical protein [Pararoseomonas indoligenes]MBP0493353.1 hypothetical protein [Pararoseomonas indoligenes]
MRILAIAATAVLVAAPALADMRDGRTNHRSPGPPIDRGGRTADSDRAYNGGGMVLEGAPGAPAPMPQQTAPAGSITPEGTRSPGVSIVR